MKKSIIIAALTAAGVVAYLLNRKKTTPSPVVPEHSHHLTNVFSKAKQKAIHVE